jgi:hypothetical protein
LHELQARGLMQNGIFGKQLVRFVQRYRPCCQLGSTLPSGKRTASRPPAATVALQMMRTQQKKGNHGK